LKASIGILGGTFDPIHFGHLRLAQEMGESLELGEVRFIPAARPPHRSEPHCTAPHRAAMVQAAIAGNPLFALDTRELERSGPSYMVDTLSSLRAELGKQQPLVLLLGTDAFFGLPTWHRWQQLFDLCHICVAHRPGFRLDADNPEMGPELGIEWQSRFQDALPATASGHILLREITALDISASRIRQTLMHHRSPRYLMPDAVFDYIHTHHLYEKTPYAT
jgi:nicotinate-nucleotide adenylyltransferase